jgi:hypothetical protein
LASRAFVLEFETVKGREKGRQPGEESFVSPSRASVEKIVDYFRRGRGKAEVFPLANSH